MVKDVVVGFEDPVGEPVVAHELPDVFYGLSSGDFGGSTSFKQFWSRRGNRPRVSMRFYQETAFAETR